MKLKLDLSQPFNLEATLCCGQVFRWQRYEDWWFGTIKDEPVKIRQISERELEFQPESLETILEYFGLHDHLPEILLSISKDEYIVRVVKELRGLRIINQNPYECLVSFICATYKNVPAIQKMLFLISCKFGTRMHFEGHDMYCFPTAEQLSKASLYQLRTCGLGYRAKYILETARMIIDDDVDFEKLKKLSYQKVKDELQNFPGVGLKVADCIALFSLHKFEAFPVDVWIRRAIAKHYANHFSGHFRKRLLNKPMNDSDYRKLSLFGREYFAENAGYAQEYLYHYERAQAII